MATTAVELRVSAGVLVSGLGEVVASPGLHWSARLPYKEQLEVGKTHDGAEAGHWLCLVCP